MSLRQIMKAAAGTGGIGAVAYLVYEQMSARLAHLESEIRFIMEWLARH